VSSAQIQPSDPSSQTGTQRRLTSAEFRDVVGSFASGVTVITTVDGEAPYGTTASAVSSLSLEPPMVLICLNRTSSTGQAISRARRFAINVLDEDQAELASRFARKDPDKFVGVDHVRGVTGQPLLAQALATIECRVVEEVTGGTHTVFLSEVDAASARQGSPLAYFRGQFGRLALSDDEGVYDLLRERVLTRRLPAGRRLSLSDLAEGLAVPPGPLFHALGRLTSERFLLRDETGAFVVPPVTEEIVADTVTACAGIEIAAAEMSLDRVTNEDLRHLRTAMERTLEFVSVGRYLDVDKSLEANSAFHEVMVGFAGSPSLVAAYRRLALNGIMARAFEPHVATEADAAHGRDHADLVDAFEARDLPRIRDVIVRHAERTKEAFRAKAWKNSS
jgi:flavin reductase (DIM6/NTAB) family NADH-FMN oxidoreductase RutF/DNA-binding GntR family transcriptional regulator